MIYATEVVGKNDPLTLFFLSLSWLMSDRILHSLYQLCKVKCLVSIKILSSEFGVQVLSKFNYQ